MSHIDPAEISAFLDGELPPERAGEVRRAIAQDASLRSVYEELGAMDARLKAAGAEAAFQPRAVVPSPESAHGVRVALAVVALAMLRLAMKLSPLPWEIVMSLALLAVVVGWLLRRLGQISEESRPEEGRAGQGRAGGLSAART